MKDPSGSDYDSLTPKQRAFVDYYLETGNASEAARRAGYKGRANSIGPRLLANVGISRAIAERTKPIEGKRILTAQEVLEELSKVATECEDPRARVKALELLGKRHRLWVEQVEVDHRGKLGVLGLPVRKK